MKIKQFILASFIFIALVAGFGFYLNLGNYALIIGDFSLEMPVFLWLIAPLILFFLAALFHMSFYGFLRYLKFKNFFSDSKKFENFIRELLLENTPRVSFYTKEFKNVAKLTQSLKEHEKLENYPKINEIYDILDAINKEEYINLNKFKLANTNKIYLKNETNRIKSDVNYAYIKLKNLTSLNNEFEELAFDSLLKKGAYEQIKNVKIPKNQAQILSLIKRFKEGNLELSVAEFEVLLMNANFNKKEFVNAAKMSVKLFNPDTILALFNKLKNENSDALRAYCFLLAEFKMFDELFGVTSHSDEEMNDFKAVLALREKNINIDLNHFII